MHFLKGAALAALAFAVGSWVGLGRPEPGRARELGAEVGAELATRARELRVLAAGPAAPAPEPSAATVTVAVAPAEDGPDLPPSPLERDPSLLPSTREPWRMLNPEASVARAWMVAEGPRRARGDGRRLVTLTFDDGPAVKTTPRVLRLLARHRVRATFFVIGSYLEGETPKARASRDVLRKIKAAGHLVGNHTYDHALLTSVSHTQVLAQIDRSATAIERTLGTRPTLFRPPYGGLDAFGEAAVRERGLDLVLWSVEKADMLRDDEAEIFRDLVGQLDYKEGGIVLLHDVRPSSVRVLERLLGWLRARPWDPAHPERVGYEVVDLPSYLRAVAHDPLPYETRDELERARRERRRARPRPSRDEVQGDG